MNRALVFAGGKGSRMTIGENTPKQFLKINDKCIIIHTLEKFERCEKIDDIIVICIEGWIPYLKEIIKEAKINKVSQIIPGGLTGFDSRYNGLEYLYNNRQSDDDIILIHDGVRPFIDNDVICENIYCAEQFGNAITVTQLAETLIYTQSNPDKILNRDNCFLARAPQTFKIASIFEYYSRALSDGNTDIVDSASLAYFYGEKLHYVFGPAENIKVTTPIDYYAACGILTSMEKNLSKYK